MLALSKVFVSSALLLSGVEGQYRSRKHRAIDGKRSLASHANASNATTLPATTAAPTTAAATTAAAATTTAAAATTAAPTAGATTTAAPTAGATTTAAPATTTVEPTTTTWNSSLGEKPKEGAVKSTVAMTVEIDISAMAPFEKTTLGNAFAYGLHASMCNGVKSLWNSMADCFMGKGKTADIKLNMKLDIASQLVQGGPQPSCTSSSCYGGATPAPARRLAKTALENKAEFEVKASGASFAKVAEATASLKAAEKTAFKPAAIAKLVKAAAERPALKSVIGNFIANITKAVEEATVNVTAPVVSGDSPAPPAPTSGAFATGVAGVFAVVAGAALF